MQTKYPLFIKNMLINEFEISEEAKDYFANLNFKYLHDLIENSMPEDLEMKYYQELINYLHKLGIKFGYEIFTKEEITEAIHANNLKLLEELGFSDEIVKKLNSIGIYTRKDLETGYYRIIKTYGIGKITFKNIQNEMFKNGISFVRYGDANSRKIYDLYTAKKNPNITYTSLKCDGLYNLYNDIAEEYKKSQNLDELLTLAENMYFKTDKKCPKVTIIDKSTKLSTTTINELRELGIFTVEALIDYQYSIFQIITPFAKKEIIDFMVSNNIDYDVDGKDLNEIKFPYELINLINQYNIRTDKELVEQSRYIPIYFACTTDELFKSAYGLGEYKVTSNPSNRLSLLIEVLTKELTRLKEENQIKEFILSRLSKLIKADKKYTSEETKEIDSTFKEYRVLTRKQG